MIDETNLETDQMLHVWVVNSSETNVKHIEVRFERNRNRNYNTFIYRNVGPRRYYYSNEVYSTRAQALRELLGKIHEKNQRYAGLLTKGRAKYDRVRQLLEQARAEQP